MSEYDLEIYRVFTDRQGRNNKLLTYRRDVPSRTRIVGRREAEKKDSLCFAAKMLEGNYANAMDRPINVYTIRAACNGILTEIIDCQTKATLLR